MKLSTREFYNLAAETIQGVGHDFFYEKLAELSAGVIGCERWLVVRYARFSIPEIVVNQSMDESAVKFYFDGLYKLDPWTRLIHSGTKTGVLTLSGLHSTDIENSYYDEIYRTAKIYDELAMLIDVPGQVCIAVCLDLARGRFSEKEVEKMKLFYPMIIAIHQSHLNLSFAQNAANLGLTKDTKERAVTVLDRNNQKVYSNNAWRGVEAELHISLESLIGREQENGIISLNNNRVLHWEKLGSQFAIAPCGTICVIETEALISKTRGFEETLQKFSKVHNMTERESSIVELVVRGFPNSGIAKKIGISPGTVRNHRHRMYNKLDITSERELFLIFIDLLLGRD